MSTYEQLRGARLKFLDQDPANASNGQVWYNSATGKDRVQGIGAAAWSSAANASNPPRIFAAGDGPPTAGWVAGGGASAPSDISATEEFNGSGWASGTALPGARYGAAGVGPQTAALLFNGNTGSITNTALEYDGSTWASPTTVPSSSQYANRAGTQTAALAYGGANPGSSTLNFTAEYDGSSWTTSGNMAQGVEYGAGTGTETAALCAGGYFQPPGGGKADSQEYNGSTWSSGNNINTTRYNFNGFGVQTAAVIAGGRDPSAASTATETYDGTTFTTSPATMATAKNGATGMGQNSGSGNTGWVCGEDLDTEEYNFSTTTITAAAWASGANYPSNAVATAGAGTRDAAIGFGGYNPGGNLATSFEYDGSSWTSAPSLSEARQAMGSAQAAAQNAALAFGGYNTPGPPYARAVTDEYDGSSWTTGGNLNSARDNGAGIGLGIQTAAVAAGGSPPSIGTEVEEYNGTSWTASPTAMPEGKRQGASMGTSTAGAVFGGFNPTPSIVATHLEYDGSSWTSGGSLNTGRFGLGGAGTTSNGLAFKGATPSAQSIAEQYNGTAWATASSTATAAYYVGSAGNSLPTGALSISGRNVPGYLNTVEEFTGETTSANPAQSLTTSS